MTVANVDGGMVSLAVINFDPSFFWHYLLEPSQGYLQGLALTFGLAVAGQTLGVVIGLLAAFARLSRAWPLRSIARLYTWVIRGTPLLVQIVFVYTALAAAGIFRFHDIQLGPATFAGNIQAAIVALSLNEGAYMSEIIRAGILSVDPGQSEAAKSLGMPESTLVYWLRPRGPADQRLQVSGDTTARGDAAAADPKALQIQVRELEAKVRRLEMEKEILKKATAFFANQ